MISRTLETYLHSIREAYSVFTLTGPRQSGKTTLCRSFFKHLPYVSLEDPDERAFATNDPKAFLRRYEQGAVFDEIQRAPELPSYLQSIVDEPQFSGQFVLTGSQNFALHQVIGQSLAGRTAVLTLLPFSVEEVETQGEYSVDHYLYSGFYPRIYDRKIAPYRAMSDYVATYLERDLRQLSLVKDLSLFQKFMALVAGRVGQIIQFESLANDIGVSQTTIREWVTLLEASYILFRLPPFFKNLGKRLVKTPKLYFYDVGLASYLLGIENENQIRTHPLRGALFENLVVVEAIKWKLNHGRTSNALFYRDSNGNEVDLVLPDSNKFLPIEIKSAETIHPRFFKGLTHFEKQVTDVDRRAVVYGGIESRTQSGVDIMPLRAFSQYLDTVFQ